MPLVSVIVRTKDRPALLREALESLAAQTHRPLQVIVVNDGGVDVTPVIEEFSGRFDKLDYLVHENPRGRSAAANTGLSAVEGEFFAFLDDDDLLLPWSIEVLLAGFKESPSAILVYGQSRLVKSSENKCEFIRVYGRPFDKSLFFLQNYIPTGSFLIKSNLVEGVLFDESLPCLEDWDFLLRLLKRGDFSYVKHLVHIYRLQSTSFASGDNVPYEKEKYWPKIYRRHWETITPEILYHAQKIFTEEILELSHQRDLWQQHYLDLWQKFGQTLTKLNKLEKNLEQKLSLIENLSQRLKQIEAEKRKLENILAQREAELAVIYDSLGWQLLSRWRKAKEKILPAGSKRRSFYDLSLKATKVLISQGPGALFSKTRFFLAKRLSGTSRKALPAPKLEEIRPEEINLPRVDNPEVSIVIPVYNQLSLTLSCLKTLAQHTPPLYEVILSDDASTDETPKVAPKIENLVYIRAEKNRGFLKNANAGARVARGRYLVFLNNDTLLTPGWLEALLKPLKEDHRVGLVGAKLIYPDGRLQEAGGIIFRDASGWNYGHLKDPERPEYNFLREVDYCSAACVAIKRALFEKLGGFDPLFAPAYYEDTDLAFRIRKKGYKVVYQPRAVVYHLEGASCGRDLNTGLKRYQVVNREKFFARWQKILQEKHYPPDPNLLFVARERLNRGIILVADHYVPLWDQDSGSLRMYLLLQIFQELGFKVIFWPDNLAPLQPYTSHLQEQGIEVIYGSESFENYLQEYGRFIDLLWACRVRFAPRYLPSAQKAGLSTVFDTIDLHYLRELREAKLRGDKNLEKQAEETKKIELSLARAADRVIVVSPYEEEILRKEGIQNVFVLPNIHEPEEPGLPFEERKDLMFIGSFQHPPNEDAVCWFVKEIWPLIKKELPQIKFYVVGASPTRRVKALAREDIIVTGYVPEVAPYFKKCRVFVAPLRYGAGLKGKVGQAMAFGLPAVLTSIAAEGLKARPGEEFLLADAPEVFAKEVIRLYQDKDLWEKLAKKSREHIKAHFSKEAVKKKVAQLLEELVPEPKYRQYLQK